MSYKRYAVAAAAAGVVFTGVYASAATLGVDSKSALQFGTTTLQCDTDGVDIEAVLNANNRVNKIKVTDIAPECVGFTLTVKVFDVNRTMTPGAFATGTIVIDSGTEIVDVDPNLTREIAHHVDVEITGGVS